MTLGEIMNRNTHKDSDGKVIIVLVLNIELVLIKQGPALLRQGIWWLVISSEFYIEIHEITSLHSLLEY